jgi:ribosomal protein S18 acetylase RimI-like enzyme
VHAQFAATIGDRMVGLIGAQHQTSDSVYLYSLWLEPAVRHRGLAHDLLMAAVSWARDARVSTVTLRVDTDNDVARSVYESVGFIVDTAEDTVDPTADPATTRRDDEVTMRLVVG